MSIKISLKVGNINAKVLICLTIGGMGTRSNIFFHIIKLIFLVDALKYYHEGAHFF